MRLSSTTTTTRANSVGRRCSGGCSCQSSCASLQRILRALSEMQSQDDGQQRLGTLGGDNDATKHGDDAKR